MLEPSVVDAHVHFWDPDRMRYPWLDGQPELRRVFRPDDIRSGAVQIEAVIVVEADRLPSQSLTEVEWAVSLSSPSRPVVGVVAAAELDSPTLDVHLQRLTSRPEVKGIRHLLQDTAPGFCLDSAFVDGVASLAPWDLVFDLCVREQQLAEATALVARCPGVTFVLDHLGKPAVRSVPERSWRQDIERLAALPNVRCKLSGLTTEVVDPPPITGSGNLFRPYLEHALQSFGPDRCMFGSDWPVASMSVTYDGWVEHVVAALTGFSAGDSAHVLGRTAADTYRLDENAWQ
jgi:L-fuconolactonase